jgi:hypothetical protein
VAKGNRFLAGAALSRFSQILSRSQLASQMQLFRSDQTGIDD